jgi:starch synthase
MVSDIPSVAPEASTLEKEKSVLESAEENPMKKLTVDDSLLRDSANNGDGLNDSANTAEKPITPLAGPNVMNIIVVAAECAPWSKTGKFCSRFL